MPYRLFIPRNYHDSLEYPLVLWLHGSKGRGTDNIKNISGANATGSHVWTTEANQSQYPCFVVAPQCPDSVLWVGNDGNDSHPDQLDDVIGLLGELRRSYHIDSNRICVAGQSVGGNAVWEVLVRYPKMFAAALPLCGTFNEDNASKLTDISIWAFQGTADTLVPVTLARDLIEAIRHAGGQPRYTEYDGVGHDVWDVAFKERDLIPWVLSQRRAK